MSTAAIVILNWNGQHFLNRFLGEVVKKSNQEGVSVYVADNGSTDNSVAWIKENQPEVTLIEFEKNYGFTGGYNKALAQIDADYFILLNSDIEVTKGWVKHLIDKMDNNPNVGICMPKIRSYLSKPSNIFEYAGAAGGYIDLLGYPFCRGRILSNIEEDNGQYDHDSQIFWASGACMMVRSTLWRELGGLDESFFAHMEEIDFCWRAKLVGNQVWVFPGSVVYHVGGGTLPNNSPKKLFLNFRNNLLMLYKNLSPARLFPILFIRMLLDGAAAIVYILQGKFNFFISVIEAHVDFWKRVPKIERSKRVTNLQLNSVFKGSIIISFFISFMRLRFRDIEENIS